MFQYNNTPACFQCEEQTDRIKDAKHYLLGVIEQIYSGDKFDETTLDHNIEELCSILEVKVPDVEPQIERKKLPHEHVADWIYRGNTKMIQPEGF